MGFTKPYVTKVAALPTWWDDSLWDDPASRAVGLMHLSRHLGIDIGTLQDPSVTLGFKDFGLCKFKKQSGTTEDELLLARVIATRAAQLAVSAMDRLYRPIPSASDLRATILEQAPWVGLTQLLDYCWDAGVPVLHVNNFPRDVKKPMGFTLRVKGRPAVVLCLNKPQPAWLLFVLAHELGHLHHNHVPEDGALLDESVRENEPDAEETQADQYAIEVLTGHPGINIQTSGRWPNAKTLAVNAVGCGRRNQIDPGHLVLNCAHAMGGSFWGVANAALKILDPTPDAVGTIGDRFTANLDWERLPEDSSEFLTRVTRQVEPE